MRSLIITGIASVTLFSCNLFQKKQNRGTDEIVYFDTTAYPAEAPAVVNDFNWTGEGEILQENYKPSREKKWVLKHTELDVRFDFEKRRLLGTAYITAQPYAEMQDTLALDAKNLEILSILLKSPGQEKPSPTLNYVYEDSAILKIIFPGKINPETNSTICINYISKPYEIGKTGGNAAITDDRGLFFINHDLADPSMPREIWTQGETESNSHWFPTIDAPNQKMTQKITMTVPDTMVTLSNGTLIKSIKNNNKTRTDIWEQKQPHAPYLTMMAIGNWSVIKDKWRGREVNYLVEKKYEPFAKLNFGNTPEMMEFFSQYTGVDFAWDKYSQVVVRDFVSGAMENTSATVHMEGLQQTPEQHRDNPMEDYVSHELFHQWFGDLVTAESWANITVNESFATYGEYLWRRYKYGQTSANYILDDFRSKYNWLGMDEEKKLVRFDYEKQGDVFDGVSYQKGALILHMLQYAIGENIFKKGLKIYLEKNKFGTAEADDLREAMEEASGKDLHWFWDEWYYGKGHPKISLIVEKDSNSGEFQLHVQQNQTFRNAFVFPVKITWQEKSGIKNKTVWINKRNEFISFENTLEPEWYIFDTDNVLLADVEMIGGNVTDLEKQVRSLQIAHQNCTDEGLKYRLFSKAADIAEFSQDEEVNKAFGPFLKMGLQSEYSFTVDRALRFQNANLYNENFSSVVKPEAIIAILKNHELPSESRALAIATLNYMKISEDSILQYTSDPSPAVCTQAIFTLDESGNWKDIAMRRIQIERGVIAQAWARKLLSTGLVNKIDILNNFLKNQNIDLDNLSYVIRTSLAESNLQEDILISEYLFEKFKKENNIIYIKVLAKNLQREVDYLNKEIDRIKEDGGSPETSLLEKKRVCDDVIAYSKK